MNIKLNLTLTPPRFCDHVLPFNGSPEAKKYQVVLFRTKTTEASHRSSEDEHSDIEQSTVGDPECNHSAADDLEIDSESHDSSGTVAQISSTCSSECCKSDLRITHLISFLAKKGRVNNRSFQRGWFVEH